jgi:arsenite-transporting ATPase
VLGVPVGSTPVLVRGAGRLDAVNLDALAAFAAWLEPRRPLLASIAIRGTYLDEEDVGRLLQLSLPGIDEVIGLLAVTAIGSRGYDDVVVDTAPTGHTLRLLSAPALLERVAEFLDALHAHHRDVVSALRGRYVSDSADALIAELDRDGRSLAATLRDPSTTRLSWVTLPEPMALEETSDALMALTADGLHVHTLVVNRVTEPPNEPCEWCQARRLFEARALAPLHRRFAALDLVTLPELEREPRGIAALRDVARKLAPLEIAGLTSPPVPRRVVAQLDAAPLVRPSAMLPQTLRWILFGGKGGVGKSTCAAAFAIDLAGSAPSRRFLLMSTDPAHSLSDVFGAVIGDRPRSIDGAPPNLHVREIDVANVLDDFRRRYLESVDAVFERVTRELAGASTDRTAFRQLVDLAPPGVDEVIAIADVAEALTEPGARYSAVVSDTAPTGHALRLLQTPEVLRDWTQALMAILLKYREVVSSGPLGRLLVQLSRRLRGLSTLVADPRQAQFVVVTRPARLPREESTRLRENLRNLKLASTTTIVNALGAGTCTRCRKQIRAQADEMTQLRADLRSQSPYAIIGTPAVMPPPHGVRALSAWACTWRRLE